MTLKRIEMVINFCNSNKMVYFDNNDIALIYENQQLQIISNQFVYNLTTSAHVAGMIIFWINRRIDKIELRVDQYNTIEFICCADSSYDAKQV